MGLDMYLTAERFLFPHRDNDKQISHDIAALIGNIHDKWFVKLVTAEIMYWRKANAIHRWFVINVQDGVDECEKYRVCFDDLQKLSEAVNAALAIRTPENAAKYLPTQSGFFFGNTEYNQWYWDSIEKTKEFLDDLLPRFKELEKDWDFYYRSSW